MDMTPNLNLPYLQSNQARKHVTLAQSLQALDALVFLTVDSSVPGDAPPAEPFEGQRALVGPDPAGDWSGQAGKVAAYVDGVWQFHTPLVGWTCYATDTGGLLVFDGAEWTAPAGAETVDRLGVATQPDATNRLSVSSPASLFNHAGDSHRMVINRATTNDHSSFLLQTDFVADAELGLSGADGFAIKVSDTAGTLKEVMRAACNETSGDPQLLLGASAPLDDRTSLEVHNQGMAAVFNRLAGSGGVMLGFFHQGVRRGVISVGASGNTFIDGEPSLVLRAGGVDRMSINDENVELDTPLRLDRSTVANLPDPGTAGAGSVCYVVSGPARGLVYSIGTAWLRVADDTPV